MSNSKSRVFYAAATAAVMLVAAVAGLGFSLAHWTDRVDLSGSASMGTLVWDLNPTALSWNTNHVMSFSVAVRDNGNGRDTGLVDVNLDNAYPLSYGTFLLTVKNEGTVPVHVTFWVEAAPSGSCDNSELLDYILLNPAYDAPYYNSQMDIGTYSDPSNVSNGWTDPFTHPVSWWIANHGSPATALSLEDIMASGQILKLPVSSTTILQYDSDNIIMPGEKSAIFVWIGISDALEQHEELMGIACHPAFTIHYVATQALP